MLCRRRSRSLLLLLQMPLPPMCENCCLFRFGSVYIEEYHSTVRCVVRASGECRSLFLSFFRSFCVSLYTFRFVSSLLWFALQQQRRWYCVAHTCMRRFVLDNTDANRLRVSLAAADDDATETTAFWVRVSRRCAVNVCCVLCEKNHSALSSHKFYCATHTHAHTLSETIECSRRSHKRMDFFESHSLTAIIGH